MKKRKLLASILGLSLALAACGGPKDKDLEEKQPDKQVEKEKDRQKEIAEKNPTEKKTDVNKDRADKKGEKKKEDKKPEKEEKKEELKEEAKENTKEEEEKKDFDFFLDKDKPVYSSAQEARLDKGSSLIYPKGDYYIYKKDGDMINISRSKDQAGGWINPQSSPSIDEDKPIERDDQKDKFSSYANTSYGWSWAYPESTGAQVLQAFDGIYKKEGSKAIYLTFDCGYEYKDNTEKILDILKECQVKAVFFTTVDFMNQVPSTVKRMVSEGHIVGNHTLHHLDHPQALKKSNQAVLDDLLGWEDKYRELIGKNPEAKFFRPPEGKFSERSLALASSLGYRPVLWSYAYQDWDTNNQPNPGQALEKINTNTKAGLIPLLHSISDTNIEILGMYIEESKGKGFSFELLN